MAFSFMQKYQKPIMFIIIVFSLSTFSVTGAMMAVFGKSKANTAATFEVVPGKKVSISDDDYLRVKRNLTAFNSIMNQGQGQRQFVNDEQALDHVIRVEEAKAAGIVMADKEVSEIINRIFPIPEAQYRRMLAASGVPSVPEFERTLREMLLINRLEELNSPSPRVTSEEIYEQFKKKKMRLSTEYIAFKGDERLADMNPIDFKTPEVKTWFDARLGAEKRGDPKAKAFVDKYRIPEKIDLEVVYADFAAFDPASSEAIKDAKVEDAELRAYYDTHPDWFTAEPPKAEAEEGDEKKPVDEKTEEKKDEAKDGTKPLEAKSTDEKKPEENKVEPPKPKPFDDVKEDIRHRLLAVKLVEKAYEQAKTDKAANKPGPLEPLATRFHLKYQKLSGLDATQLEKAELIGSPELDFRLGELKAQDLSTEVWRDKDRSSFVRVLAKIPSRAMAFDDVEAKVRVDYMLEKALEKAATDAQDLLKVIEERAKEKVKDKKPEDLAAWEAEEEEKRKKRLSGELKPEDEPKDVATLSRQAEMQKKKSDFDELWKTETGVTFDEVVKEKGLQTGKLEAYTVVAKTDDSVKDEKDLVKKYLRTTHQLDTLKEGMCSSSLLRDEEGHTVYVAKLLKKEEPAWSELTAEEFKTLREEALRQRQFNRNRIRQMEQFQRFQRVKLDSRFHQTNPMVTGGAPKP